MKPTIVLVHGAFAESASWDKVIDSLARAGHPLIAAANPLQGVATDAAAVGDLLRAVDGPVVLVGHSYGGMVISNVPADAGEITGLVYVCAFAPEPGETCFALAGRFPGSTLGDAVWPVPLHDGTTDLYIVTERFRLDELVRRYLSQTGDPRQVVTDARAPYSGLEVDDERALVPGGSHRVGATRFEDWLTRSAGKPAALGQSQPEGTSA